MVVAVAPETNSVNAATLVEKPGEKSEGKRQRPDAQGRFGKFGGKYVPETLIAALTEVEDEFQKAMKDSHFQVSHKSPQFLLTAIFWMDLRCEELARILLDERSPQEIIGYA